MVQIITVTVFPSDVANEKKINSLIRAELAKKKISYKDFSVIFEKKSVDARHGTVKVHLRYKVFIDEKPEDEKFEPKWKTADGKEVKNKEIWQEIYSLTKKHKVNFNKVKGHSDVELNNRCDELARAEIDKL